MTGDARQFALEIDREFAEQMGGVRDAVAYVGLAGIRGVVMKSPVLTGRFRGNWSLTIGSISNTTTETVDPSGGPTIARAQGALSAYAAQEGFPMIYIQNSLPYAVPLEDGHSKQAPNGMMALTVAELAALWNGMRL